MKQRRDLLTEGFEEGYVAGRRAAREESEGAGTVVAVVFGLAGLVVGVMTTGILVLWLM